MSVECQGAVEMLVKQLHMLPHPGPGSVRLPHPGLVNECEDGTVIAGVLPPTVKGAAIRRLVSEAIVLLLETKYELVERADK